MAQFQEVWIDAPAGGLNISVPGNVIDARQGTEVDNLRFKGGIMEPRRGHVPFEGGFLDGSVTGIHTFRRTDGTFIPIIGTERDLCRWVGTEETTGTCTVDADGRTITAVSIDLLPSALPAVSTDIMPEDLIRIQAVVSGVTTLSDWLPILWITQRGAGTGELKVRGVLSADFVGAGLTFYIKRTFRFLTPRYETGTAYIANGSDALVGVLTQWLANAKAGDRILITGISAAGGTYHRRWYSVKTVTDDLNIVLNEKYEGATILVGDATTYILRKTFTGGKNKRWSIATFIGSAGGPTPGSTLFAVNSTNLAQKWDGATETTEIARTDGAGGGDITAKYVIAFRSYLIYANIAGGVQNWINSDFDDPEDLDNGVANEEIIMEGGDEITGIKRTANHLEIHKRSGMSIYAEVGGDPPFQRVRHITDVGNILPYALSGSADASFFMARDNLYIFDGQIREIDPQNNSVWRKFKETLSSGEVELAHSFYSEQDRMYYLFFPAGSGAEIADKAIVISDLLALSFYTMKCSAIGHFPDESNIRWIDIPFGVLWDDLAGTWDDFGNTAALPIEVMGFGDDVPYNQGDDATFTNGSAVVTVATPAVALWLTKLKAGDMIRPLNGTYYTIKSVDLDGQLTLERNFAEGTVTSAYEARPMNVGIHYFQRGFDDFGDAYTSNFRSKVFVFDDETALDRVIFQTTAVSSDASLNVKVFRRYDESDNFDLAAEGNLPLTGANTFRFDLRLTGRQFYFEFGSTEKNQNYAIRRWGFRFTPMSDRRGKINPSFGGATVSGGTAPFGGGGIGGGIGGGLGGAP